MIMPFRKCKKCEVGAVCQMMRLDLSKYLSRKNRPLLRAWWPWDSSLCPLCVLNPNHFKVIKKCELCWGNGNVGMRRIRGTGSDDIMDLGEMLVKLPVRWRTAVERWTLYADIGFLVEAKKWMSVEDGYRKVYLPTLKKTVVHLRTPRMIYEYHSRTVRRCRPTRQSLKRFQENLESGLLAMKLKYQRKLFERVA